MDFNALYSGGLTAPFTGSISQWVEHVKFSLPSKGYGTPGELKLYKFQKKALDLYCEPHIRQLNWMGPIGSGKSMLSHVVICNQVCTTNHDLLWTFNVADIKDAAFFLTFQNLIQHNKCTRDLLVDDADAVSKGKICFKTGTILLSSATKENLQGKHTARIVMDEADKYDNGLIELGKGRVDAKGFSDISKVLTLSRAGLDGDAWTHEFYDHPTVMEAGWTCPSCKKLQKWQWEIKLPEKKRAGIIWTPIKDDKGHYKIEETIATVRAVCRFCGFEVADNLHNRNQLDLTSEYVITKPGLKDIVSIRWPNMAIPSKTWASLVEQFLKAKQELRGGDSTKFEIFFREQIAEPYKVNYEQDAYISDVREYIPSDVWPEETHRFMAIDKGRRADKRYYVTIIGCAGVKEWRLLNCGFVETIQQVEELQKSFKVAPQFVGLDTGDHPNDLELYKLCCEHGRPAANNPKRWLHWLAFKGAGGAGFKHDDGVIRPFSPKQKMPFDIGKEKEKKLPQNWCWFYNHSNYRIKNQLMNIYKGQTETKWVVPSALKDNLVEFEAMMNSEYPNYEKKQKDCPYTWCKLPGKNVKNEALDCMALCLALSHIHGLWK